MAGMAGDPFFVKAALWAQISGFVGGVLLAYAVFERRKRWALGFGTRQMGRKFSAGVLLGALLISASTYGIWLFGVILFHLNSWTSSLGQELVWGFLLFIGVAVNEELFARGYLQGLVKERFGTILAVTVSTLVFALLHSFNPGMWNNPVPLLNLLLAGLLFGLCREYSNSLWMPIGLHLSWNYLQGCIYGFEVSGTPMPSLFTLKTSYPNSSLISGGSFGAEGSLVTTMILMLGIAGLVLYYRRQSQTVHTN
ncbi:CPBP family intramembrane glutamic endopeptidase [Paenibacillus alba]|uniref:CPBP family intramembrane metalloprotease n=1 Tax=Paenibacillus alba TaxID=1197127 RepID=A0ABU6G9J0_9BACL|nr:CPBP family intramembrane glutamic endopeptidase [Paenibacillus alba]MEC0230871.1 CPBP family intramembrane metalloprotease [Paenibacillus alba]